MIEVDNLKLAYVKEYYSLYDISFKIDEGEKVAFVGQNDSGKTSLLRVLAKLEKKTSGEISFNEFPISDIDFKYFNLGYIPSVPIFIDNKTASWHFKYLLSLRGFNKNESELKAKEVLNKFNLQDKKIKKMTLFEKRMLQFALLSLRTIKVLLIDEILDFLTIDERKKIMDYIKELFKNENLTAIIATKDVMVAKELGLKIYNLKLGSLVTGDVIYERQ